MKLTQKQIREFRKKILTWFEENKRDLPWRRSRNPYSILVSEVMLQQTQVGRVMPKFDTWMKTFPNLQSLAKASSRDVLLLWSGLGYNRRALYLQTMAQELTKNNNGIFPQDEKTLREFPGIGEYTARALLCFAFDQQITVIDTNVKKVIAVTFFKGKVPEQKVLQKIAEQLLPQGRAYEWNQALMDYASAILKKEKIILPKQKLFKDSDRYYRGQILKILLEKKELREKELPFLNKEKARMEKILKSLEKDGFVKRQYKRIMLG